MSEEELLPISALQHLAFCERQCALIHLEGVWSENRLTAEGRVLHERVHEREDESRGDVRIARGLRIRSLKMGLIGQADVVEFHRNADGSWQPFPVEYKRGRPKTNSSDSVQLCAQAFCLEEMLNVAIPAGALFYGVIRRRLDVAFDQSLRDLTIATAKKLRVLIGSGTLPAGVYGAKCKKCSLFAQCMPKMTGGGKSAVAWLAKQLEV